MIKVLVNAVIRFSSGASLLMCLCNLLIASTAVGQTANNYTWIQYVPEGMEARAITESDVCPIATVDSVITPMQVRSTPGEGYPIRVCTLPIAEGTHSLAIANIALKLPKHNPQKILLLGDTGCRLKGKTIQNCNDPQAWPFQAGAARAAQLDPDLVIHVGDFHYRETPCPDDASGCANSPYGDNWQVWKEDFFGPVGSLLLAAPWAMVRGNHEECQRGGRGWARILDPFSWDADSGCLPARDPFFIDIGSITLAVMDVSSANEDEVDSEQAEHYRAEYAQLSKFATPVWIAQHRPIWALEQTTPTPAGDNKTLAQAATDNLPANIQLILSGHHHAVEVLSYEETLPLQFVTGNSGDELSMDVPENSDGLQINGVHVKHSAVVTGIFGYSLLEQDLTENSKWHFTSFDYEDNPLMSCDITGREVACSK